MQTYFIGNIECRLWCRYKKADKISLPAAHCGLLSATASAGLWDQSMGCTFHLGRTVPALVPLSLPKKAGLKSTSTTTQISYMLMGYHMSIGESKTSRNTHQTDWAGKSFPSKANQVLGVMLFYSSATWSVQPTKLPLPSPRVGFSSMPNSYLLQKSMLRLLLISGEQNYPKY